MRRRDLIKKLKANGWWELRDNGKHAIFTNGQKIETIPRHTEVNENLSKAIIRRRNLK